jgi:3-deoxy-7-phosphoheptulonate synthase
MIVVLERIATAEQVDRVIALLIRNGWDVHRSTGEKCVILGAIGQGNPLDPEEIELLGGVRQVVEITRPYRLAEKRACPEGSLVHLGSVVLGGAEAAVIPGFCEPLGTDWENEVTRLARESRVTVLRLSCPQGKDFSEGLWERVLPSIQDNGFHLLLDIIDVHSWPLLSSAGSAFLVQHPLWRNSHFLEKMAESGKSLLLQSSLGSSPEELLLAGDGLLRAGFRNVALAVQVGRDKAPIPSLDVDFLLHLKQKTHLPVLVDLLGSGKTISNLKLLSFAAIGLGMDGVFVELGEGKGCRLLNSSSFQDLSGRISQISTAVRSF